LMPSQSCSSFFFLRMRQITSQCAHSTGAGGGGDGGGLGGSSGGGGLGGGGNGSGGLGGGVGPCDVEHGIVSRAPGQGFDATHTRAHTHTHTHTHRRRGWRRRGRAWGWRRCLRCRAGQTLGRQH
jgi:hypothetical protein